MLSLLTFLIPGSFVQYPQCHARWPSLLAVETSMSSTGARTALSSQYNLTACCMVLLDEPKTGSSSWNSKERANDSLSTATSQWTEPLFQHHCKATGRAQRVLTSPSLFPWGWPVCAAALVMSSEQCERGAGWESTAYRYQMDAGKRSVLQREHGPTLQGGERESEAPKNTHRLTCWLKQAPHWSLSIYQADRTCITNAGGNMDWMGRQCNPAAYCHCSSVHLSVWVNGRG